MHLNEFREFLSETKGLGKITQDHYVRWMKDFDPNQISQTYINQYIQDKGNNSQVRGAIMSLLEMMGIKKEFDMPQTMTGRKKKRVTRRVSVEEFEKVRDYLYSQSFKKGLIFDLIYQGALRRAEVSPIRINSFMWELFLQDPSKPCKLIVLGKGDKERVVLINPETTEKIFNHFASRMDMGDEETLKNFMNSPSLLFGVVGRRLTNKEIWKIVRFGSIEAIGRDIRPHELRHARATSMAKMGIPVQDIKNYLGHSSIATTEIYLHKSIDESIINIEEILQNKNQ